MTSNAVLCPTCGTVAPQGARACDRCGTPFPVDAEPTRISQRVHDPLRGVKLGEYVVEDRIGIGGMGIVYRAQHPLIGNSVAIKVLRPDIISSEMDLQRFLGEAKAINQVRHPGVVSIFGAGDTPDGRKYLVMELLQGESLETRLNREGRLATAEVVPILEEVLAALSAVHAAGVVHRDLKPGNVFLARQSDNRSYVKLLDFGLARRSNNLEVSRVAGTPDYISPEHARGRPPGPPADLYSFGVMAFHLLTGRLPFIGDTAVDVMEQHVSSPPPNPAHYDGNIPPAMCDLILRLLAKDPVLRPDAMVVKLDLKAASRQLRAAATQIALPAIKDREKPTQPGPAQAPTPSPRDTEPQLAQVPTPTSAPRIVPDSRSALGAAGPTPVTGQPRIVPDTSPELPGRRWPKLAGVGGLLVIVALSAKALLDAREESNEPRLPEGRRPAQEYRAGAEEPEEPEPLVVPPSEPKPAPELKPAVEPKPEPKPAVVKRTGKRDWRAELRSRLEKVQQQAQQQQEDVYESAAKRYLARLDGATARDQADLEEQTSRLESKVSKPR